MRPGTKSRCQTQGNSSFSLHQTSALLLGVGPHLFFLGRGFGTTLLGSGLRDLLVRFSLVDL